MKRNSTRYLKKDLAVVDLLSLKASDSLERTDILLYPSPLLWDCPHLCFPDWDPGKLIVSFAMLLLFVFTILLSLDIWSWKSFMEMASVFSKCQTISQGLFILMFLSILTFCSLVISDSCTGNSFLWKCLFGSTLCLSSF